MEKKISDEQREMARQIIDRIIALAASAGSSAMSSDRCRRALDVARAAEWDLLWAVLRG